jgi:alkanesulfonate monooxygenase SsuD/methylene tetrahydromethanopterin reductase-like flavin-dependent oxidoreductase (luciferase family)
MKLGFALRSSVFKVSLIPRLVHLVEDAGGDSVWFPDVGGTFDVLDMCAIALGSTRQLRVGTGILRAGEQEPASLTTRVRTLDEASGGRFILGLGAGHAHGQSGIEGVVALAERLKADYPRERKLPPVFFAALRGGMLRAALASADGAILNFCPPSHAKRLSAGAVPGTFTVACYIKLFFAESDAVARRMLAEEMVSYDRFPPYHKMFEEAGLADAIATLEPNPGKIPDELLEVSLWNPNEQEVTQLITRFSLAGVTLPIIYPYISGDESYQLSIFRMLASISTASGM